MSHEATMWAVKVRGISPAEARVLWHLADCHNPVYGCFPTQDYLAENCEMDERSVRRQLYALREKGHINWIEQRERNKRRANRYTLAFERDFSPAISGDQQGVEAEVEPDKLSGSENAAGGQNGTVEPDISDSLNRTPVSAIEPVREPVKEPVTGERAREREDRQAKPGTAEFSKRVQRFLSGDGYQGGEWPKWAKGATIGYVERQFTKLSEEDRRAAEKDRDAFLAKCARDGGEVMGPGNYFRDRVWEVLSERDRLRHAEVAARKAGSAPPSRPDNFANAYGPVHAAMLFRILCAGPQNPAMAPKPGGYWMAGTLRTAWPHLASFWQQTDMKGGIVASDRDHDLSAHMEFVPADSETMAAWRQEVRRRGLPDLRMPDGLRGLYLPAGGPERFNDFAAVIEGMRGNDAA